MKFNCTECNWTGSENEMYADGVENYCPNCDSINVDVDDREPDPLTEQPSEVRSEL